MLNQGGIARSGEIATVRFGSMARLFQIPASIVIERGEILRILPLVKMVSVEGIAGRV